MMISKKYRAVKSPDTWVPVEAHQLGEAIAERVEGDLVLTLAPLIPLESGVNIYQEFATGPFTWRVAGLLSPDRQLLYQVISKDALPGLLATRPPAAILVGFERGNDGFEFGDPGGLERPLEDFAIENGYQPHTLPTELASTEIVLWVR